MSLNEVELEFVSILLGALNSVGDIYEFPLEQLKILDTDVITQLVKGLPRIRLSQMQNLFKQDIPQVLKLQNERRSSQLYTNLVLQLFSLGNHVQ